MVAVLVIATLLFGVWLYGRFDPERFTWFPKCLFLTLTGWKCPGCGSQRAIHQLLHGHFVAAFQYNAFFICAIPVILFYLSAEWLKYRFPRYYLLSRNPILAWILVVLTILWWVLRNVFGW